MHIARVISLTRTPLQAITNDANPFDEKLPITLEEEWPTSPPRGKRREGGGWNKTGEEKEKERIKCV